MSRLPTSRPAAEVFETVAAEYDRSRPTYPDELVDRACALAGIGSGARVLESGCGSGQLTRSLLARGLNVTALEPGKQLLALAERNLRGAGTLELLNARFEEAELPPGQFEVVFSASAFHWIDPDVSWQKAAEVLTPGGTLALIQYFGLADTGPDRDQDALLALFAAVAPEVAAGLPGHRDLDAISAGVEQRRDNVSEVWGWLGNYELARAAAGRLFCDVRLDLVPIVSEQTAQELNAMLRTTTLYARLSPTQRQTLERENVALAAALGRPFRSSLAAILVTARRAE